MNSNEDVLDSVILLIKLIIFLSIFYSYFKNRNRNKLRNPYFRSIDKILSKYYSGYFFKFYDLEYYPELKLIYKNLLYELHNEGIYAETLEAYIKTEDKKSSYIKSFIALIIGFFGGQELKSLIANFNSISVYFNFDNFKEIGQLLSNSAERNQVLTILASVVFVIISLLFLFVVIFLDNPYFIKKHILNNQSKLIIEDVISYYRNNESTLENLNVDNLVFEDENICFLDIRIIKIKNLYTILFPKSLMEKRSKLEWNIPNVTNRFEIPNIIFRGKKFTFIFDKISEGSMARLNDIESIDNTAVPESDIQKLSKIFEILFLAADIEYSKQTYIEKKLQEIMIDKEHYNKWSTIIKIGKIFFIMLVFLILLFLVSLVVIFIIRGLLFYFVLFIYSIMLLADYIVRKLFS